MPRDYTSPRAHDRLMCFGFFAYAKGYAEAEGKENHCLVCDRFDSCRDQNRETANSRYPSFAKVFMQAVAAHGEERAAEVLAKDASLPYGSPELYCAALNWHDGRRKLPPGAHYRKDQQS